MCHHADCCCDVITAHYKLSILCQCSVEKRELYFLHHIKMIYSPDGGQELRFLLPF